MSHHNILFQQVKHQISRHVFESVEKRFFGPNEVRKFGNKCLFLFWAYAHITNSVSMRSVVESLNHYRDRLYHLGFKSISLSTISDAISKRTYKFFKELFFIELADCKRSFRRMIDFPVKILDATEISFRHKKMKWNELKHSTNCLKVHVLLSGLSNFLLDVKVTSGKIGDITWAKTLNFARGTILLMDRAYFNSVWWRKLNRDGVIMISRLRKDLVYHIISRRQFKRPETKGKITYIISEERIQMMGESTKELDVHLRAITLYDEQKQEEFKIVTNDFKMRNESIAQLYKSRWQVELFFKWIKQNLKIKKFISYNSNGIQMQIWTALLVYMLLWRMRQQSAKYMKFQMLPFLRYIKDRLMIRDVNIHFGKSPPQSRIRQIQLFEEKN